MIILECIHIDTDIYDSRFEINPYWCNMYGGFNSECYNCPNFEEKDA